MVTDDIYMMAVGPMGARTWAIAAKIGVATATARRRLSELERRGLLRRDERYSYVNDIYWRACADPQPPHGGDGR